MVGLACLHSASSIALAAPPHCPLLAGCAHQLAPPRNLLLHNKYCTTLRGNRYQCNDQFVATAIRRILELLPLCLCLVDMAIPVKGGFNLVTAIENSCTCPNM